MTAAELLDALHSELSTQYPTRRALSAHVGRVSCVIEAGSGEYDAAICEPVSVTVTADVRIVAAGMDEQNTRDLPHHLQPVGALIRKAGWVCMTWQADSTGESERPTITITATAVGEG